MLSDISHMLILVTTILLRCIIESSDNRNKQDCTQHLVDFMDHLAFARDECDWELADTCLERYRPITQSIAESLARATDESNVVFERNEDALESIKSTDIDMDTRNSYFAPHPGIVSQFDWLDHPWEHFWLEDLFPLADGTPLT